MVKAFRLLTSILFASASLAAQPSIFIPPSTTLTLPPPDFTVRFQQAERQDAAARKGFDWASATKQSGILLGVQHSLRMLQEKTREHLDGKWWHDYLNSVSGLDGWNDGNPIITNYVGHPMMGAVTGFVQIHNDPAGVDLEWSPRSSAYWKSRMKALGWATLYSTHYELGPLGEAMIGNVGYDRGTMAYVDLVVTPLGGFGMILLEDWLDQRYIRRFEQRTTEGKARFLRVVMNPQRSIANLLRFKRPSHRDTRRLKALNQPQSHYEHSEEEPSRLLTGPADRP